MFISLILGFLLLTSISVKAGDTVKNFVFSDKKIVKHTSVKDQQRTGTCWSYAATSFIEAELIRMGYGESDLSEMYFVRNAYSAKGNRFVRFHGEANFSQGGQAHDVLMQINKLGFVPETDYKGNKYGSDTHVHSEMAAVLSGMLEAVVKNKNRKLSTAWNPSFEAVLDTYMGKRPASIEVNGKQYNPAEFAKATGFDADNYIELTSYSHHPYYESFVLEIPDNWTHTKYYNLPVEELMQVMKNAIENDYSVCWDGDVSEKGFSHNNNLAILPQIKIEDLTDSEKSKWSGMSTNERRKQMYSFENPVPEIEVTQELRQETFDNYVSTDDHLMHMVGKSKDQNGTSYYLIKNSWAESNDMGGYLYMSEEYVKLKTVAIMIHKDALPKKIAKKLGL